MEATDFVLDSRHPDVRAEFAMVRAEFSAQAMNRAFADQLAAIHEALREAREFPEVFVGGIMATAPDAVEFAVRAAVADIAVRLSQSENAIRSQAHEAEVLIRRAPQVWALFREGDVSIPNAAVVAEHLNTLPEPAWSLFEAAVLAAAESLTPPRFRTFARVVRERIHTESLADRHQRSATDRRVWLEPDLDGMSWLHIYLPADVAGRAMRHLDKIATALVAEPDETRTQAQIRADAAGDAIAGILGAVDSPNGTRAVTGVTVAVTVPVMTLLGHSDEPGTLEGYGPIAPDVARKLAAHAPSFFRLLTHPVSGVVMDLDRTTYRVPADLQRWIHIRDGQCSFIGCGRLAKDCDIDHTIAWTPDHGATKASNLAALCRNHHRLKHNTGWQMKQDTTGITWTSPTGNTRHADPPPF